MALVELTRRGRVAVLTLTRPPVNAISDMMIGAFQHALDDLGDQTDWSVLHIRSGQGVFAAGADLDLILAWADAPSPGHRFAAYIDRLQALYQRIERLPQVTFCEIGGAALGGGFELALACDLRMAALSANLGLPEVGIGLIPAAGGTQRLTRLCGRGTASRLILSGDPVDGGTAATLGIVQWAVPPGDLQAMAVAATDRIAALPLAALQAAKQCISAGAGGTDVGYGMERDIGAALLGNEETQSRISAFLRKRMSKPS